MTWIPDNFKGTAKVLTNFFTTAWFARPFPELVQEYGPLRRIDLRCGFSKQFLHGKLTDAHTS
jgi:hypothetical protein